MRFDVVERCAERFADAFERGNLVENDVEDVGSRHFHLASAETLQIGKRWMCADLDTFVDGGFNRFAYRRRVARVKSASDID